MTASKVQINGLKTVLSDLAEVRKIIAVQLMHGNANLQDALVRMQKAAAGAGVSSILAPKEIAKVVAVFQEFALATAPGSAPTQQQLQSWTLRIAKSETTIAATLKQLSE